SLWSTAVSASQTKSLKDCWLHLFKQPCVWAMIFAHLCYSSTYFTLMSWLPTFFKDTYPEAKGWVFNVVPWFVAMPSSLFGGTISDHLIREGFETVTIRKVMQFCSMGLASVFTILLCKTTAFLQALAVVSVSIGLSTFHNRYYEHMCCFHSLPCNMISFLRDLKRNSRPFLARPQARGPRASLRHQLGAEPRDTRRCCSSPFTYESALVRGCSHEFNSEP
ncbi:hypothetical protein NFI96_018955, partial [Prochilodus magdalenae]